MTGTENKTAPPRLRPGLVPLWRGPGLLQIGLDGDAVVMDGVPDEVLEVVRRLDGRHRFIDLAEPAGPEWATWVVAELSRVGLLAAPSAPAIPTIRIVGAGTLGAAIARGLADAAVSLSIIDPEPPAGAEERSSRADVVREEIRRRRQRVPTVVEPAWHEGLPLVDLTILAPSACEPDRLVTDALLRQDAPHLVVRQHPCRAIVGPLVIPGRTTCLRCVDLVQVSTDEAWPLLAVQLARTEPAPDPGLIAWAAGTAVYQALAHLAGATVDVTGGTLEIGLPAANSRGAPGLLRRREWPRHPACPCSVSDDLAPSPMMVA